METLVDQIILEASHRRTGLQCFGLFICDDLGTHTHSQTTYLCVVWSFWKNVVTEWLIQHVRKQVSNYINFLCVLLYAMHWLFCCGSFPLGIRTDFSCCRIAFGSESISQAQLGNDSRIDTICFRTQLFHTFSTVISEHSCQGKYFIFSVDFPLSLAAFAAKAWFLWCQWAPVLGASRWSHGHILKLPRLHLGSREVQLFWLICMILLIVYWSLQFTVDLHWCRIFTYFHYFYNLEVSFAAQIQLRPGGFPLFFIRS